MVSSGPLEKLHVFIKQNSAVKEKKGYISYTLIYMRVLFRVPFLCLSAFYITVTHFHMPINSSESKSGLASGPATWRQESNYQPSN